jgi:hypothetical protein
MPRTVARERNESGLIVFLDSIRALLINVQNLEVTSSSTEEIENILLLLEESASTLVLISAHVGTSTHDTVLSNFKSAVDAVLAKVRTLCQILTTCIDASQDDQIEFSYIVPSSLPRGPGRPVVVIQREQIEFLRELHFSWAKIARLLGVSESTIHRKRNMLNIPDEHISWTTVSGN